MCKGAPPVEAVCGRDTACTEALSCIRLRGINMSEMRRKCPPSTKTSKRTHGRASDAPLEMPALRSGRELLKKAHEHGGRLGPGGSCEKRISFTPLNSSILSILRHLLIISFQLSILIS